MYLKSSVLLIFFIHISPAFQLFHQQQIFKKYIIVLFLLILL